MVQGELMPRNLNINCQTEEKLKEVKGKLDQTAKLLKFDNLHELIRWQASQSPEKLANALRGLRIEELQQ
jgi:hypothetical protein